MRIFSHFLLKNHEILGERGGGVWIMESIPIEDNLDHKRKQEQSDSVIGPYCSQLFISNKNIWDFLFCHTRAHTL